MSLVQWKNTGLITIILKFCLIITVNGQITVMIDPGHGGRDPGNLRRYKYFKHEKELNLEISMELARELKQRNPKLNVVYTRTTDETLSLEERVKKANKQNVDYFISVHCNASSLSTVYGAEIHIHGTQYKRTYELAKSVNQALLDETNRGNRGIKDAKDGGHSLYVLKHTRMPAILVECGFMSNFGEEIFLNTPTGQRMLASAIAKGLVDHIHKEHPPQSSFWDNINISAPISEPEQENSPPKDKDFYAVQILASTSKLALNSVELRKAGMSVDEHIGSASEKYRYKYTVGKENSLKAAKQLQKKMVKKGYKGAFVVKL